MPPGFITMVVICLLQILPNSSRSSEYTKTEMVSLKNEFDFPTVVSWTACKTLPGLTKAQQSVCHKYPDVTMVALQGLEMAIEECQYQFRNHRWNCSSLSTKNKNPHTSVLLNKGYRESAFSYAIAAAGITHNVAKACSMGRLMACGCEPTVKRKMGDGTTPDQMYQKINRNRWKWGGCSHNMDFGVHFSKLFLDVKEKQAADIQSLINLHNNEAGRLAVSTQTQVRCKCHGMSGSCQLKTCWRSAPEFRVVGDWLKERFRNAVLVNQSNVGNRPPLLLQNKSNRKPRSRYRKGKKRRKRMKKKFNDKDVSTDLLYYQKSPSFCERDPNVDFPGTTGRLCNRTSRGMDNCSSLCCGRGYNIIKQKRTERCHCRFEWCCYVVCQNCTINEWVTVCK